MIRGCRPYGGGRLVEREALSWEPDECPGVALPVDELAPLRLGDLGHPVDHRSWRRLAGRHLRCRFSSPLCSFAKSAAPTGLSSTETEPETPLGWPGGALTHWKAPPRHEGQEPDVGIN